MFLANYIFSCKSKATLATFGDLRLFWVIALVDHLLPLHDLWPSNALHSVKGYFEGRRALISKLTSGWPDDPYMTFNPNNTTHRAFPRQFWPVVNPTDHCMIFASKMNYALVKGSSPGVLPIKFGALRAFLSNMTPCWSQLTPAWPLTQSMH